MTNQARHFYTLDYTLQPIRPCKTQQLWMNIDDSKVTV